MQRGMHKSRAQHIRARGIIAIEFCDILGVMACVFAGGLDAAAPAAAAFSMSERPTMHCEYARYRVRVEERCVVNTHWGC